MFDNVYKDKKVLVTGHTGFKGTWLVTWLLELGAEVIALSDEVPTQPSMFEEIDLEKRITHYFADIRELPRVIEIFNKHQPDFVFHLAAQPIVSVSYEDPVTTFSTNVMGTVHVLEALRQFQHPCIGVIITSDKCYDNVESVWGYKETDAVGGKDIYSGSKGAAELVFKSYYHSFFKDNAHPVKIASGRAGNVIGGGDWARDRIVVDCMRAWSQREIVEIRSPDATRPWQHVMEPLSGYLTLGMVLHENASLHGESFNFGPRSEQNHTVCRLLEDLSTYWDFSSPEDAYKITGKVPFHEAGLLKLNCDKTLFHMKWQPTLNYDETIRFVSEWYFDFYRNKADMFAKTVEQISEYQSAAVALDAIWAR